MVLFKKKSKRNVKRRPFKRVARKSKVRSSVSKDTTIVKYNPGRTPVVRVMKNLPVFLPYTAGGVGTNGLQFVCTAAPILASSSLTFDPSGLFGTASQQVFLSGPFSGIPAQIPDWTSLVRLYTHYKVTKIVCTFTAQDTGSLTTAAPIAYVRYNNSYPAQNPTILQVSEQRNWIRKTFTVEHPNFKYSFYPKVQVLVDNSAALATDSRQAKSMGWTNISTPIELYGLQVIFQYPGSAVAGTTYVNMDIEYHMMFKQQN